MRSRQRLTQWVLTWLLIVAVCVGGALAAVFHQPLLEAAGVTRSGAAATVAPSLFAPEPSQSPAPPAAGSGLVDPPSPPAEGVLPQRAELEAKLGSLDRSALTGVNGADAVVGYEVIDVATGEVLAAQNEATPLIPASNTKLLTALAVLNAFDGSETFATRVLESAPGQLVLVGGGDPMLTSAPTDPDDYPQTASTQALAEQVAATLLAAGRTTVTLGYDATYFTGAGWNATWPSNYRDQVTQISALWLDEGRPPGGGPRSQTPAIDAATTFAAQLTEQGITVSGAPTPVSGDGEEIARVESPPVHVLVETFMQRSNNSFTEVMGFQLAAATGHPTSFEGSVAAIREQLVDLGLWDDGTVLHDASGLSRANLITANTLAGAIRVLQLEPQLSVILDGLPIAGVTGTLSQRFSDALSRPARGLARAKTGTLSLVSSLAGTTVTDDGRLVAFAFLVNGVPDGWAARVWTDQATGVVTACGC